MVRLPFDTLQELDLPITELIGGRIGCIPDAFLTFPYEVRETLPREDRDLVVLAGKAKRRARLHELAEHPGRVVVAFAPGDVPLRQAYSLDWPGLPPNVIAAFSTNNQMADRRAVSVPLGVRVNKLRHLQFVRQNRSARRDGLLYGNFALSDEHYRRDKTGAPHIRARIVEQLRGAPWASMDISDDHRDDHEDLVRFYSQIARHRFALSPQGNGIDCYRTWEILYLGAIPIVMVSTAMSEFADLPILFTNDYSELTEEYLERRWQEMTSRSYAIDRMLKSWYTSRFLAAVSTLDRPRFVCWQVDGSPFDRCVRALARSSRSEVGLVAETPTPPFTGRLSLTKPDDWHVVGGLDLRQNGSGLEVLSREEGRRVLEMPLDTIVGAPFRVSGKARPANGSPLPLELSVRDGSERIASTEVGLNGEQDLSLEFVARSDRTVLTLSDAANAPGGCGMLLSDLSVKASL